MLVTRCMCTTLSTLYDPHSRQSSVPFWPLWPAFHWCGGSPTSRECPFLRILRDCSFLLILARVLALTHGPLPGFSLWPEISGSLRCEGGIVTSCIRLHDPSDDRRLLPLRLSAWRRPAPPWVCDSSSSAPSAASPTHAGTLSGTQAPTPPSPDWALSSISR